MSDTAATFESVTKHFGRIEAVSGASFDVQPGEILGFIGPNGSGKTTTVRLMLGIYRPSEGVIRVLGRDPARDWSAVGSQVGIALEQPGLDDYLTAREYLEYYGGLFRMSGDAVRRRCSELLEMVGLSDRADSILRTYSKGMRQRVSMARCMLNRPRLMLLDEPFDGLDVESRRMILAVLPRVSVDDGTSIFVTSHNLSDVEEISDRIAIVRRGRVLAVGSMEALRAQVTNRRVLSVRLAERYSETEIALRLPGAEYAFGHDELKFDLDSLNGGRNELLMRLVQAGIAVQSLSVESLSLEDVYLTLTKETKEERP